MQETRAWPASLQLPRDMAFFWTSPWVIVTAAMIFILQGGSSSPAATAAQSCQTIVSNRRFQTCQQLPQLQATLAWTFYDQSNTIDFAFSGTHFCTSLSDVILCLDMLQAERLYCPPAECPLAK